MPNNTTSIRTPQISSANRPFQNAPREYHQVAEGMEQQFAKQLFEHMKQTIDHAEEKSQSEKIYDSLLDDERTKLLAQNGQGLGIKEVILNQIAPQYAVPKYQEQQNSPIIKKHFETNQ